jgi:selenocysteine-specific elongation factor
MKSVIVGTAGHIDHGKTALVKALTGIDADRLEEEKRRGITIDLGFAHLELPLPGGETLRLGFVDVPGHERFVRNMLAGVSGIDLVLLVIAADESIKPQTREHFDICRLLAVRRGITVLTKADLVDRDTLDVVRLEVEDFLRGSFLGAPQPILAVSSLTGAGLKDLQQALVEAAGEITARDSEAIARLPIDRVFSIKGFGTVVTGTLVSGAIQKEEELEIFPKRGRARVRGVEVHGQAAEKAVAGERTALNLAGVATEDLARGMTLAPPHLFQSASRLDVKLSLLRSARPLKDRARVHVHGYTSESVATVVLYGQETLAPGEDTFAQLRLAQPALLLPGDRFIIRQLSPVMTIGGGVVVDSAPMPKMKKEIAQNFLRIFAAGDRGRILAARIARRGPRGISLAQLVAETGWSRETIEAQVRELLGGGEALRIADSFFDAMAIAALERSLLAEVALYHQQNPLTPGINKDALWERVGIGSDGFAVALAALTREKKLELAGDLVRLPGRGIVMKDEEAESKAVIERAFRSAGLTVPALREVLAGLKIDGVRSQKIVTLLLREKVLVKIADDLVFHREALEDLRKRMAQEKAKRPRIDVARFKDLAGVSRKYAIPLLEYLDREHVTRRIGDERVIL